MWSTWCSTGRSGRRWVHVAGPVAVLCLVAGCGGEDAGPRASPGLVTTIAGAAEEQGPTGLGLGPVVGPCTDRPRPLPDRDVVDVEWLPDDLELPARTYLAEELPDVRRVILVVPLDDRAFAEHAADRWGAHGWILGVGEAEPGEHENSFIRGERFGIFRARSVYCDEGWSEVLMAIGEARRPITTGQPPAGPAS